MRAKWMLVAALHTLASSAAAEPQVQWEATPVDGAVAAKIEVSASAEDVYRALADVANWRALLSDVERVELVSGENAASQVRLLSRSFGHVHVFLVRTDGSRHLSLEQTESHFGGTVSLAYVVTPLGKDRTHVRLEVRARVGTLVGLFTSREALLETGRRKVQTDLVDLARRFTPSRASFEGQPPVSP